MCILYGFVAAADIAAAASIHLCHTDFPHIHTDTHSRRVICIHGDHI